MSFSVTRFCAASLAMALPLIAGCAAFVAEPPAAESIPEPKIVRDKVALNPSVSITVTRVRFFESGRSEMELRKPRVYRNRFPRSAARTVYTELHFEHPRPGARIDVPITVIVRHPGASIFRIEEYRGRIEPDWSSSEHRIGVGHHSPGHWEVGIYTVEVYINGDRVATGSFAIHA